MAKQHDVDRSLIRLWARKYECGEFDAEVEAAKTLHEYEAKIAQLKRALRPSVIFRKVTNGFRSLWGAEVHAHARSVIGTGRLNGLSPHQAIARALAGQAILAA